MAATANRLEIVVLAAGKGVRMKSARPKVLHTVCGLTLLERTLRACVPLSPAKVIVVLGFGESLVRAELERLKNGAHLGKLEIVPVLQSEQRGTGHAADVALGAVEESTDTVLILPGDLPLLASAPLEQLLAARTRSGSEVALLTMLPPDTIGYGRIVRDDAGRVLRIVEEKDCSSNERHILEVNSSIYAATRAFLKEALPSLDNKNAQGEFYLTDIVGYGVKRKLGVEAVPYANYQELLGANSRVELSTLERLRRMQIAKHWMEQGVTFEDAEATYVDEDVTIGSDTFIGAGTRLRGNTKIASGVRIDGESIITGSSIGINSVIKLSCVIDTAELGEDCQVGPFAHLRPGTNLVRHVRIGNFVETKKSELREGVKANHLSYIGDALVHENANIGAGTITCNYDGVNKHRTIIGSGAFIGSNTSLVAPVNIGEGAVVGASSAITKDVPAGALGLERSEQIVVSNWAKRRQARAKG